MAVCHSCGTENPDVARFCMVCATPLQVRPPPPLEARKTVTIVFCDLVGSTALGESLDSESLREVMDRYFATMRAALERHGGVVEKFIGDAVMAVFGLPRAHEDDALRAVRAADEMRRSLEQLNEELERSWGVTLANRIGVNTGEVVVGDAASGQRLATGDAVNVAARFEQAAGPGSVLLGEPTLRLVRDAVIVRTVEPLELKGKSKHLAAFSLQEVTDRAEGVRRRLDAPLVGRDKELLAISDALDRAAREEACRLLVVLGEAGLGKSRLVAEAIARLQGRAQVLKGRCLSYGEGMTFWPLAEIVRSAAGVTEGDPAELAREKLSRLALDDAVTERVASAIGLSHIAFPVDDSFWALRQLLEGLASRRPLVVVVEDIHWAEPTMLDFLAQLVELARASMLLLCPARNELFQDHPDWLAPQHRVQTLALKPLSSDESTALMANLLGTAGIPEDIRQRVLNSAQGNPLYVEHILSMWVDDGTLVRSGEGWVATGRGPEVNVPPTISALLAARLDRLGHDERAVAAGASVVGQVFERAAVQELCAREVVQQLSLHLAALTSKDLFRMEPAASLGEQAFAFRHILIRDVAYEGMLKRVRADLHERFADSLERRTRDRVGAYQETLGYHLEQAWRYRSELFAPNDATQALGRRAAAALASAGRAAADRGDARAAVNLMGRAGELLEDVAERVQLLPDLAIALIDAGELARAGAVLDDAAQGVNPGDAVTDANVRVARLLWGGFTSSISSDEELSEIAALVRVLERAGDERGLGRAQHVVGLRHMLEGRCDAAASAWRRAIAHAERAADRRYVSECTAWLLAAALHGPMPVNEGEALTQRVLKTPDLDRTGESAALAHVSMFAAMKGDFGEARRLAATSTAIIEELGHAVQVAAQAQYTGRIEMLAGAWKQAEKVFRRGYEVLVDMNASAYASTVAGQLGEALCRLVRFDEAEAIAAVCRDTATEDDLVSQALWRRVCAEVLSAKHRHEEAVSVATEAVELTRTTDMLIEQADSLMVLGVVLEAAGHPAEAERAVADAEIRYERKGDIVSTERAKELLKRLTTADGSGA